MCVEIDEVIPDLVVDYVEIGDEDRMKVEQEELTREKKRRDAKELEKRLGVAKRKKRVNMYGEKVVDEEEEGEDDDGEEVPPMDPGDMV